MMDVYGFAHEDLKVARNAVEKALSIQLEAAKEETPPGGSYFRGCVPSGPWVQICRNSGPFQRWTRHPSNPWHPDYGLLVFVHGPGRESSRERLRSAPDLVFLETEPTMDDYVPPGS